MPKKIDSKNIEIIVSLINSGKTDSDIAEMTHVSTSYVNKLRNNYIELKEKKEDDVKTPPTQPQEVVYSIVDDTLGIDDIELLQLKINSLERTIKWYKELVEFKKANKK